nr:hypothetical protein Iba_chr02dCG5640 [Ipomoea batatas]
MVFVAGEVVPGIAQRSYWASRVSHCSGCEKFTENVVFQALFVWKVLPGELSHRLFPILSQCTSYDGDGDCDFTTYIEELAPVLVGSRENAVFSHNHSGSSFLHFRVSPMKDQRQAMEDSSEQILLACAFLLAIQTPKYYCPLAHSLLNASKVDKEAQKFKNMRIADVNVVRCSFLRVQSFALRWEGSASSNMAVIEAPVGRFRHAKIGAQKPRTGEFPDHSLVDLSFRECAMAGLASFVKPSQSFKGTSIGVRTVDPGSDGDGHRAGMGVNLSHKNLDPEL